MAPETLAGRSGTSESWEMVRLLVVVPEVDSVIALRSHKKFLSMPLGEEHVEELHGGLALASVVYICTKPNSTLEERDMARLELSAFSITDIALALRSELLSDDSSLRRKAVSILTWALADRRDIPLSSLSSITEFFCSRLSDWASVEPSVEGLNVLYTQHVRPGTAVTFTKDAVLLSDKDRSDLSLLLGFPGPAGLPEATNSLIECVLTKLLINVHAPSFGQQVRLQVLGLFRLWISDFSAELEPVADVVVKGLAIEGEDERDIACLSVLFECIDMLFEKGLAPHASSRSTEDLFELLKSYFPIQLIAKKIEDDPESLSNLKKLLNKCFGRFRVQSIEFLSPQLNDSSTSEDAFVSLLQIGKETPDELIPFLLAELHLTDSGKPPPLLVKLWQETVSGAEPVLVDGIILRLIETHEDDLVIQTAQASTNTLIQVLYKVVQCNRDDLLKRISQECNVDTVSLDPQLANKISEKFELVTENLQFLAALVPSITEVSWITRFGKFLMDNALFPIAGLVNLFASHLDIALTVFDKQTLLKQLVQSCQAAEVSKIILALFDGQNLNSDDIQIFSSHYTLVLPAVRTAPSLCGFLYKVLGDQIVESPAEVLAAVISGIDSVQGNAIIKTCVVDKGQLEILRHLSPERVALSIASLHVWEDLLGAAVASDDPVIVSCVARAAGMDETSRKKVFEILAHCISPTTWAEALAALIPIYPEESARAVGLQKSSHRLSALFSRTPVEPAVASLASDLLSSHALEMSPIETLPVLAAIASESLLGHQLILEKRVLECTGEVQASKLVIRYFIINHNIAPGFLTDIVEHISKYLESASLPVLNRVGALQVLAVMPEVVPSGKVSPHKAKVLKTLEGALAKEPLYVVRKQLAVAITNWFNV